MKVRVPKPVSKSPFFGVSCKVEGVRYELVQATNSCTPAQMEKAREALNLLARAAAILYEVQG